MKPSSFESVIRLQFDCLIRKVIDRTVKNYYRELGRRAKHEIPFCDVTERSRTFSNECQVKKVIMEQKVITKVLKKYQP